MTDAASPIMMTAEIVSAFVGNNTVRAGELPDLIAGVYASLLDIGSPAPVEPALPRPAPAVSIRKSITDDYIVCLEDGKRFKSMRRHLQTVFGMTPDDYRTKWGLPHDYPMVAPSYARTRSEMAKRTGLGSSRRKDDAASPESPPVIVAADVPQAPAKRRGRPAKQAA